MSRCLNGITGSRPSIIWVSLAQGDSSEILIFEITDQYHDSDTDAVII